VLALGDGLEHDASVVLEIQGELLLVQETTISLLERIWEIPVVQSDERCDSSCEKVINELDIVVDTSLVDGVVTATQRDDSGPGDGEAVGLSTERLQQLDILSCSVVRITGNCSRGIISDLARNCTERIPDRGSTAILFRGTLNLVSRTDMLRSAKHT
jgi:hypothetical protein